jgi:signal transduction histidine kinase
LCDELAHAHRLAIHLDVAELPAGLASDVELCLYRITQEALHNVVKHSGATNVAVRLDVRLGELALDVVDDGRGFDPIASRAGHGAGLVSMQERARTLNGSATLTSAPGSGARVHVRVPLDRAGTGERRQ